MRNNNHSVSVSMLVGTLLLTGVSIVQAAPNTFNTALPVPQDEHIWREQLVLRERSDDGPMDREVSVQALGSVLGYGVTTVSREATRRASTLRCNTGSGREA